MSAHTTENRAQAHAAALRGPSKGRYNTRPRDPKALPLLVDCGSCGARWHGPDACHCPTCHRTFGDLAAFDRHRTAGDTR